MSFCSYCSGYMAPEYAMRGHYSMKSDVFSFGILMLEIISGRRSSTSFNTEHHVDLLSLVCLYSSCNFLTTYTTNPLQRYYICRLSLHWMQAWQYWTTGTVEEIFDSSLRGDAPGHQMLKCVHIGLLCVQSNPDDRPMMSTVNVMLSGSNVSLHAPLKPVFFNPQSGGYSTLDSESHPTDSQSIGKSGGASRNEVSITELEPR